MPDRFDLMTNDDIASAFRISAEYCRLANPARIDRENVGVLNRGELWLRNLLAELEKAVAEAEIPKSHTCIGRRGQGQLLGPGKTFGPDFKRNKRGAALGMVVNQVFKHLVPGFDHNRPG